MERNITTEQMKSTAAARKLAAEKRRADWEAGAPERLRRARAGQPKLTYLEAWDWLIKLQEPQDCCQNPITPHGGTDEEVTAFAEALIAAIQEQT